MSVADIYRDLSVDDDLTADHPRYSLKDGAGLVRSLGMVYSVWERFIKDMKARIQRDRLEGTA